MLYKRLSQAGTVMCFVHLARRARLGRGRGNRWQCKRRLRPFCCTGPAGLEIVDRALTFADDWTDPDRIQYFRKKSAKCAEILVPNCVDTRYLLGAYVCNEEVCQRLQADTEALRVEVNSHLFFV